MLRIQNIVQKFNITKLSDTSSEIPALTMNPKAFV